MNTIKSNLKGSFRLIFTLISFCTGALVLFLPNITAAQIYSVSPATDAPIIDPSTLSNPQSVNQGDDSYTYISFGGSTFEFYGVTWSGVWVNNNGNLTFGSGDSDFSESLSDFLAPEPRIGLLWDDLNPSQAPSDGGVFANLLTDQLVVTWKNVPEYYNAGSNNFQIILEFSSGTATVNFDNLTAQDGIVGIGPGTGNVFNGQIDFSAVLAGGGATYTDNEVIVEQFTGGSDPFDLTNTTIVYAYGVGYPVADADPDIQTINVGVAANFDGSNSYDTDGGTIVSYDWDFGDSYTGSGVSPSHTYSAEGTYDVCLTVTDNDGKSRSDHVTVIALGDPPVADADGPYSGQQDIPLTFDGSGSTDDSGIASYDWDFGDGNNGTGMTPWHAYGTSGTFTVTLTVTDIIGQTTSITTTASISPHPPYYLYAGTTNPGKVCGYAGGGVWGHISPTLGFSVASLIVFQDQLYAGVATASNAYSSQGLVFKHHEDPMTGEHIWTQVGQLDQQICVLVEYNGELYAGTGVGSGKLYRYDPLNQSWTLVINYTYWDGVRSAHVWGGWIYMGDWYLDKFIRWDGSTFEDLGYYGGSCIYDLEEYGDYLYGGAYVGAMYRLTFSPSSVTRIWDIPDYRYVWALEEFQDRLYIGVDWIGYGTQEGQLWRYDRYNDARELAWSIPVSNTHEGVISLTSDSDNMLYIGVGGQAIGYPYSLSGAGTGQVWTYDGSGYAKISTDGTLGTGVQTLLYTGPAIGAICGDVTLDTGNPVANVTVKVIDSDNNQVGDPIVTGSDGTFYFDSLVVGTYSVMIVTPLGYSVSPAETQTGIEVTGYPCTEANFVLTPTILTNNCRTMGYWKHQFDVYLTNRGNAQESSADLDAYLDIVHLHFDVLGVYFNLENYDFEDAKNVLTVKGGRLMEDRAKQQLFALLLNFASGRIGNETVVSDDGRVAAEAVTLAAALINDGDPDNDELAKTVCDLINKGQMVA
ncbi:MAG: PKD domain-containing protein, partial [Candidatus Zixiibacteriota bacterium]